MSKQKNSELTKGNHKLIRAWAFYDWANSVYSLVISSAIFPLFYVALSVTKDDNGKVINDTVHFLGIDFNNDSLISYVTAIAFLTIAIISPLLSGIADYVGNKKFFMRFFCYMGAFACIGLYWFSLAHLWFGLLCYFLGLIGFWGSIVFYNSYLPDIAFKEQQDKASALGFSLGYIGSVLLLLFCLAMILSYESFGFESEITPIRLSFILTGIWWIGFSQYTFAILPQSFKKNRYSKDVFFNGFKELKKVSIKVKDNVHLSGFLPAFFVYSMAVQTIMIVATYFGNKEINWSGSDSTTGLIISILLIQLVAIGGAYAAAKLAKTYGNVRVLIGIHFIWIGVCIYAYFMQTPNDFYIAAFFVGLVMGAIQSLSRSTYSKMIPSSEKDTTSFFSFYDVTEKLGIVVGMLLYGIIAQLTGSVRYAIIFLTVFFVIGVFLLLRIPKTEKKV